MFAQLAAAADDGRVLGAMFRFALLGLFVWFCIKKYKEGKREGKPK